MKTAFKVLLIATCILAIGAVVYSAVRYFVYRDYIVYAVVDCDPAVESCFLGDGESFPEFYKHVEKPAYSIPACDAWAGTCEPLRCEEGETECVETLCDHKTGEECSVPPVEVEEVAPAPTEAE